MKHMLLGLAMLGLFASCEDDASNEPDPREPYYGTFELTIYTESSSGVIGNLSIHKDTVTSTCEIRAFEPIDLENDRISRHQVFYDLEVDVNTSNALSIIYEDNPVHTMTNSFVVDEDGEIINRSGGKLNMGGNFMGTDNFTLYFGENSMTYRKSVRVEGSRIE